MTREELIAALETATEPHWTYNGDIVDVLGLEKPDDVPPWQWPPAYTASIDAALTLVPNGEMWAVGVDEDGKGCADMPRHCLLVHAPTPALALCIAAIKAQGGGA